jgi:guanylate kinase
MTREEFLIQLPSLVKNYKPSADVLEHIGKINVLMVVGPSGAGKTTLINSLGLTYVLSDNTRTPRPGEREGIDFYFRTDYEQVIKEIKEGRFVQVAVDSGGDLKATKASSYPRSGDVVMAVVADVVPAFRQLGFASTLTAFITPPSYDEWMRRMNDHSLSGEQFSKRMSEAQRSLEFALSDPETHFILSDQVEMATHQLQQLLKNQTDKSREAAAKQAALQMLRRAKSKVDKLA